MGLFRPNIERIAGYLPGEQPQEGGWIKLNTNENPYPPSPRVVEAIVEAAHGKLNLYPDPLASPFRNACAPVFHVSPDWILPANGSDENLTLLLRAFVDPGEVVAFPYPSYILYETLADLQGGKPVRLPLNPDWSFDIPKARRVVEDARLVLIPNPNSPSGNRWSDEELLALVPPRGVLVLDEAYGDFADSPHRGEILKKPGAERIIITRTFSKSFSLAGIRLGFAIARPELINGMIKVKDSYNCDRLALAAGLAAISDLATMEANTAKIRTTRQRLEVGLKQLGFEVTPSQANFVWCTHPCGQHQQIYDGLKAKKILVRYMKFPDVAFANDGLNSGLFTGLRVTVGTDAEIDALLAALPSVIPA